MRGYKRITKKKTKGETSMLTWKHKDNKTFHKFSVHFKGNMGPPNTSKINNFLRNYPISSNENWKCKDAEFTCNLSSEMSTIKKKCTNIKTDINCFIVESLKTNTRA